MRSSFVRWQDSLKEKLIAKCSDANLCSAQALQIGSIAQLVQSICLTSRGSGVRIPLLPQRSKTAIGRLFHLYLNALCIQPLPREHSSAGSEHLPYKQRVRGSNPFAPTLKTTSHSMSGFVVFRSLPKWASSQSNYENHRAPIVRVCRFNHEAQRVRIWCGVEPIWGRSIARAVPCA